MPAQREFLREFLRTPARIGAISPSSKDLADAMVATINGDTPSLVVEFGPGTGSFTEALRLKLGPESRFVAIEQNDTFASLLQKKFPDLDLVHGSVEDLPQILEARGGGPVDYIISGLPWAVFDRDLQRRILTGTAMSLREGGTFATFAYLHGLVLPRSWRFRRLLESMFREVRLSEVVWSNLPPAFIYLCRK